MASPFSAFRKNQKVMLAVVGVFLMISFLIAGIYDGSGPGAGAGPDEEVVVSWDGGKLTDQEIDRLKQQRGLTVRYLYTIAQQAIDNGGSPKGPGVGRNQQGQLASIGIPQRTDDASIVHSRIMYDRAKAMGFTVSDADVSRFLAQVSDESISSTELQRLLKRVAGDRMTEDTLYESLKYELLAQKIEVLGRTSGVFFETPGEQWQQFNRINRQIEAELITVPVSDFTSEVPEPTKDQLMAFFEEHKNREPHPAYADPGFRQRRKLAFGYFEANLEEFMEGENGELAKVTEEEIKEYYEENKDASFRETQRLPEFDDPIAPGIDEVDPNADPESETDPASPDSSDPENSDPENSDPDTTDPATDPEAPANTPDEPSVDDTPAPETPAEPTPNPESPANEAPPADDSPAEEAPAEPAPTEEPPADDDAPADADATEPADEDVPAATDDSTDEPESTEPEESTSSRRDTLPADTLLVAFNLQQEGDDEAPAAEGDSDPVEPPADTPADVDPPAEVPDTEPPTEDPTTEPAAPEVEPAEQPAPTAEPPATEPDAPATPPSDEPADPATETEQPPVDPAIQPNADPEVSAEETETPKYTPLEKVSEEIRRSIAQPRAFERMQKAIEEAEARLQPYAILAIEVDTRSKFADDESVAAELAEMRKEFEETRPDYEAIAEELNLTFGEIPLVDLFEVSDYPLGQVSTFDRRTFQQISFAEIAFGDSNVTPYKLRTIGAQFRRNEQFLYWTTDESEARVPDFADVYDEKSKSGVVVDAWKMQQALPLATAHAEKLAEQANKSDQLLEEQFKGNEDVTVLKTTPFSWLTTGGMFNFGQVQLSPVAGADMAGSDFMESTFALDIGESGVAVNQPKTKVYVVHVVSQSPSNEALQTQFAMSQFGGDQRQAQVLGQVTFSDRAQAYQAWVADVEREMEVKWTR